MSVSRLCTKCGKHIDGTVYLRGKSRLHWACWDDPERRRSGSIVLTPAKALKKVN